MATGTSTPGATRPGTFGLVVGIAGFVLLGIPLLAYVWEALNDLLAGHWRAGRLLAAVPAAVLLLVVWRVLAGQVQRWDRTSNASPSSENL